MSKPFITASDVAPLIGFETAKQFLNARQRLEDTEDFPRPMPTSLRPLLWRRDQVIAWAEVQGTSPSAVNPIAATGHNVVLLAEARRA